MSTYNVSPLNKVKRGPNRAMYDVEEINKIIDSGFIAHVAYNYNGKAICIPMAYGRIENKIYLHGSLKNRMLLALLEAREATLTIMHLDGLVLARSGFHHSVNYRSVTLFASVQKIDNAKTKEVALKCVMDYMIPNRWDSLRTMNTKEFNSTLVLELEIQTASAKVRAEGVNDEKMDLELPIWAGIIPIKQIAEAPINDALLAEDVDMPQHITNYYTTHKP
ncbi:pyridoxamine 5'-phosphate oxidase family protein [Hyunsoonleella pacifica]|uniref:Pyridoxamine 5'-phosphate oxidase family protein n=1 Tax=Hyunsoonleella pacifica TaxID=1080224 RepID=A0A4Q9FN06_9FLAO|nr:pyridoxamine 5'-phosphate oxidase family protein [Hyunsoonleella pacifica]TBN15822.1 pyridoxamine 5'-phosphate oxidase family protein [Hyunsoonleella pacifica]GGD22923.1 flavin-nucleotide-binding protein [Hyunsoonleella pacifica]